MKWGHDADAVHALTMQPFSSHIMNYNLECFGQVNNANKQILQSVNERHFLKPRSYEELLKATW